ncbi:MAG: SusC/RagA family TonB-linked outer membrane protein [Mediterranea massiliensis]|nr:SusC/RagA family TonB-linked outer membrane protein [Mediterranea massiliensis]
MKHIYKGLVLCGAFAFSAMQVQAQTTLEDFENLATELEADDNKVDVAFRSVDEKDLLGGVSVIDMEELSKKAYTTYSLDFLENVVGGVSGNIWGNSEYLVVVDGMIRDANNVLPSEIDNIVVLKGAQAVVLYGPRASKGVIQITTKRGKQGDIQIDLTVNTGMFVPKSYPKYLGSAEYMTLYNEALVNDGSAPTYTAENIYNHASGLNPYRYPNLDMYDSEYLRKMYNRTEAVAEIQGGSDRVQYYTSVGYYRESSALKYENNADNYISRFFVRGNVDVKFNDFITAQADANATFYDSYSAKGDWWSNAATIRPNMIAPLIPLSYIEENNASVWATINNSNYLVAGKYFLGASDAYTTNPLADAIAAGDSKYVSRKFQFNTKFNIDLRGITEGLFFRAKYGIDYATQYNQGYDNNYATFQPTWTNYRGHDFINSVTQWNEDSKSGNENVSNTNYVYTYNVSAQFDYSKTINKDHNLFAMVLGNLWQTQQNGQYHRTTNLNLGVQASYNYQQKYYVDFAAALPYSTKLPESKRLGFSPTVTLGWRPTAESFFQDTAFDDLMLTATYGVIAQDMDITEYYLYLSSVTSGGWFSWGDNGGADAIEYKRYGNPDLGYVKRKEFNVGLRGSLWNKLITFDFNYFRSEMNGGLARAYSRYPIYLEQNNYPTSNMLPQENINEDLRQGFDFSVYANKKFGDWDFTLGVSGMYYTTEATKRDEVIAIGNEYTSRVGQPLNAIWGLETEGFITSQDQIAGSPEEATPDKLNYALGQTPTLGDLKYKDQNGDNIIDQYDEVFLGRSDTPFRLGLNFTAKYKNWTLFVMGNGYFGGYGLKNSSYYWVHSDRKYSEVVRGRWTPETAATATFPRLTTTNGAHSFRNSDFWLYKADRFNLSQIQVTYDMPAEWFEGSFVKGLSAYVGGYNLLTISGEREHLELNIGSAPQTRFYNLGVKATF